MRSACKEGGFEFYEYIIMYIDNILKISYRET